jgi:murein DD-endopeptidase MepM/ murein hydrolase activator NlpD
LHDPAEPGSSGTGVRSSHVDQPLTRRELRERNRSSDVRLRGHAAHPGSELQPARRAKPPAKRVVHRPLAAIDTSKPSLRRRIAQNLFSVGAFVFAGALAVGLTVPANAFVRPIDTATEPTALAPTDPSTLQSMEVLADTETISAAARDGYSVTSYKAMLQERYGTGTFTYATNWSGEIRWPFAFDAPISDGYGYRVPPCGGCSSDHDGIDFTPGAGQPISAIANGVVSTRGSYGGLGNHVILTHIIDGKLVESVYGHMQHGSSPLVEGQEVKAGDLVGLVGSTGQSTGPHLHFELLIDGVHVNPLPWLQQNAT